MIEEGKTKPRITIKQNYWVLEHPEVQGKCNSLSDAGLCVNIVKAARAILKEHDMYQEADFLEIDFIFESKRQNFTMNKMMMILNKYFDVHQG